MKIIDTQYNIKHKAFEIYVSGCSGKYLDGSEKKVHCNGCHNVHSWNFNSGSDWKEHFYEQILPTLELQGGLIEKFWILGGEPLDQDSEELIAMLKALIEFNSNLDIWLWTGYSHQWVCDNYVDIFRYIDYIKVGHYDKDVKETTYVSRFDLTLQSNQLLCEVTQPNGNVVIVE